MAGFFKKLFGKQESKEEVSIKRKEGIDEIHSIMKSLSLKEIHEIAKNHPNDLFNQNVKSTEEFQLRHKIQSLAALVAGGDIDFVQACKDIIKCADKGLKINPESVYLLHMRGRSKGDIGQLKEGLVDLTKALKLNPTYADVWVEKGYIRQKSDDLSGAKNDYDRGILLDPSLQEQVNQYLVRGPTNNKMMLPEGLKFKFIVTPSFGDKHKKGLRYLVIKESFLKEYYKKLDVSFYDGYLGGNRSDEKKYGKQMGISISCYEPIIAIPRENESSFYDNLEKEFKAWMKKVVEEGADEKFALKFEELHHMQRLEF